MWKPPSKRTLRRRALRGYLKDIRKIEQEARGMARLSDSLDSSCSYSSEESDCSTSSWEEGTAWNYSSAEEVTEQSTSNVTGHPAMKQEETLKSALRSWAIDCNTPIKHLTKLLKILKRVAPDLPGDGRTLLGRKSTRTKVTAMGSGEYVHMGLVKKLTEQISQYSMPIVGNEIVVYLAIDGLPLYRSLEVRVFSELKLIREAQQAANSSTTIANDVPPPVFRRIHSREDMDNLLNAAEDANTRHQLVAHLSGVCGGSLALSADRVFKALFADEVTDWLSFHGRLVHQTSFENSQLYPIVTEVLEQRCRILNVAKIEIPKALKLAFKRAHDRHQRHGVRSSRSTSRIDIRRNDKDDDASGACGSQEPSMNSTLMRSDSQEF